MVNIYLSEGDVWYFRDYPDSEFEKTVGHQDLNRLELPEKEPQRNMESSDIDFPYIGGSGELALAEPLLEGTVISRDRVVTETPGFWPFNSQKKKLSKIYTSDFQRVFGEKYRKKYDNVNVALVNSGSGIFTPNRSNEKLYNSSTDLLVVAGAADLDESYQRMRQVRYDAATDLKKMASRVLGKE